MQRYELQGRLGSGAQGVVYRAVDRVTAEAVAIKMIDVSGLSKSDRDAALAEVNVLQTLRDDPHPFIMGYRTSFVHEAQLCMVLDLCSETLQELVDEGYFKASGDPRTEEEIWRVVICLFLALDHCHSRGILHRDVKLANLFVDGRDGYGRINVKLGDFGVSCILNDRSRARTMVGTPYYLSPELCCGEDYDSKSDIWSAGVMLYQLCNDKLPFQATNYAALILRIVQAEASKQIQKFSQPLHHLVSRCMHKSPSRRPSAQDILCLSAVRHYAARFDMFDLLPIPPVAGPSDTLPLNRRPGKSVGALPSRRVRNRHQQSKMGGTPTQVARPYPPSREAMRTRKTITIPVSASCSAEGTSPPVLSKHPSLRLSDAQRRRDARTVANLPDFGTDSADSDNDGYRRATISDNDEHPAHESPAVEAQVQVSYGVAVSWCVDGEAGVASHTVDSVVSNLDDEDREATLSCTALHPETIQQQLNEVTDEAEKIVMPSLFASLLDTLKNDPGNFASILQRERLDAVSDELTYLCFRHVFLAGELRKNCAGS